MEDRIGHRDSRVSGTSLTTAGTAPGPSRPGWRQRWVRERAGATCKWSRWTGYPRTYGVSCFPIRNAPAPRPPYALAQSHSDRRTQENQGHSYHMRKHNCATSARPDWSGGALAKRQVYSCNPFTARSPAPGTAPWVANTYIAPYLLHGSCLMRSTSTFPPPASHPNREGSRLSRRLIENRGKTGASKACKLPYNVLSIYPSNM